MKNNSNISAVVTTGMAGCGKDYVLNQIVEDLKTEIPDIDIKLEKFANSMKHMINASMVATLAPSIDGNSNQSEQLVSQALPHYKKLAENKDADAWYKIGLLYENGVGVGIDYKEALTAYTYAEFFSENTNSNIHLDSISKKQSIKDKLSSGTIGFDNKTNTGLMPEDVFECLKNDGNLKFVVGKDANNNDVSISIREMLQKLGTDIIRDVSQDYHIAMLARKMLDSDADVFAMADSRFDNELLFVSALNSLTDPKEKYNFLNSIAHLDESSLPSTSELNEKLKGVFGNGPFLVEINEALIESFYDPKYTRTLNSSVDDMSYLLSGEYEFDNPPTNNSLPFDQDPYQDCFATNCQSGVIPISRGDMADRGMDMTHGSELKALQIHEIITSTPFPEGFVFMNNTDSLPDNNQYLALKDFIKESIICPLKDKCVDSSMQP